MFKPVWIIAGSDSGCGAGIQAGLKTLTALGVPAVTVTTAWTAQNSTRVVEIEIPAQEFLHAQFAAAEEMGPPAAVVTGMLGNSLTVETVATQIRTIDAPLIVDPVVVSTSGTRLLPLAAIDDIKKYLLPQAEIVTPNLPELELLSGMRIKSRSDWEPAAMRLVDLGARQVWIKGGHDVGEDCFDLFLSRTQKIWMGTKRLEKSAHGTGCTLAAALGGAYALGLRGVEAALLARMYLHRGLRLSENLAEAPRENIFFHATWPLKVTPADLPILTRDYAVEKNPPFPAIDAKIGFYAIVETADWARKLAASGVGALQLRAKNLTGEKLKEEARAAHLACREHGVRFFLNDHWRLAMEIGCYGVHLGQEDLLTADVEAIRRSGLRLGVSTHSLEELSRSMALRPSYVALGPIFETRIKAMRFAPQGIEKLRLWRALVGIPLIAIGGIKLGHAPELWRTEIDGVAAVNDVFSQADPIAHTDAWCRSYRNHCLRQS